MSTYTKVDSKLIFRIDFKPTLKYYDQMFKLASTLEGEFEHWKATRNSSMGVLFDRESKKQVSINGQSISFATKNSATLTNPYAEISRLLVLFLSENDVLEVRRIGIRRLSIYSVNRSHEEFTNSFFNTFYDSRDELKEIAADKLDDVVLILQGVKEGFQNRNQFGPIRQEDVERLYGIEEFEKSDPIDFGQKTAVMVDTDVFSNIATELDEALAAIKEAIAVNETMHDRSWRLIRRKI